MLFNIFLILLLAISINIACADDKVADKQIAAVAVLGKLVILNVDGEQQKRRVGEFADGIGIVAATPDSVVIMLDGQKHELNVGQIPVRSQYSKAKKQEERILRNHYGMYTTVGTINGLTANFLVDTGAFAVVMNETQARRLGVDYKLRGKRFTASTAAGPAPGYKVKLNSVSVGRIKLYQVDGAVIVGDSTHNILLGMSFLRRLDVSQQGSALILKEKL